MYLGAFSSALGTVNSDSTAFSPKLSSDHYLGNPGSFAVSGTAFGGAKTILTDTPGTVTGESFYLTSTIAEFSNSNFLPNTPFTCTAYDNATLLGSATAISSSGSPADGVVAFAGCYIIAPAYIYDASYARIVLTTATINPGDTYTFIFSH